MREGGEGTHLCWGLLCFQGGRRWGRFGVRVWGGKRGGGVGRTEVRCTPPHLKMGGGGGRPQMRGVKAPRNWGRG